MRNLSWKCKELTKFNKVTLYLQDYTQGKIPEASASEHVERADFFFFLASSQIVCSLSAEKINCHLNGKYCLEKEPKTKLIHDTVELHGEPYTNNTPSHATEIIKNLLVSLV